MGRDDRINELFDRYHRPLVKTLIKFGRNEEDARDLAQETFIHTWKHLTGITPAAEWSYLRTAALRRAMNQVRGRKALKRGTEVALATPDYKKRDDSASVETTLIDREQRGDFQQRFSAALAELPEESRLCLALKRQGLTYNEIAQRLGVEMTAVQSRLHRVTKHLRERVGEPPRDLDWLETGGEQS
jgi:RNA polymerase sigma-70 factor (ECF subfamily)